jgi:succinyl-CoA synthetase beta subunit
MASASGGVDIEQVARENPEKIIRQKIDPFIGLQKYSTRFIAKKLGIENVEGFTAIVERLYAILLECDATLVEINPLVETSSGLLALDAKVLLDDKAESRHLERLTKIREEQKNLDRAVKTEAECLAKEREITYVPLDGNIAMIADGAGTGMLTLDLIQDEGGRAANFCEMGGLANAAVTNESIEIVLANPNAKVLLITLIGGLTRMDEIADGINQYVQTHDMTIPMLVRMCGTQEEAGKSTLKKIGIETFDDMAVAVQAAVAIARTVE